MPRSIRHTGRHQDLSIGTHGIPEPLNLGRTTPGSAWRSRRVERRCAFRSTASAFHPPAGPVRAFGLTLPCWCWRRAVPTSADLRALLWRQPRHPELRDQGHCRLPRHATPPIGLDDP